MVDSPVSASQESRRRWMAVLARGQAGELEERMRAAPPPPRYRRLRGPEAGLVMVRARAGGTGAAFNLGEVSVTRCTVETASGRLGHAYILGQDARHAELAAVLDAMLQDPAATEAVLAKVIEPLARAQAASRAAAAEKAAATRVAFSHLSNMRS